MFCFLKCHTILSLLGTESNQTQEDVYVASVETDRGVREQLRLYDTRGLHDGVDLPKHYFSVADGFVLVYSVDSLESFKKVDALKKEIDKSRDKKEVHNVIKDCHSLSLSIPLWVMPTFCIEQDLWNIFCRTVHERICLMTTFFFNVR